jgi:hypothetical protein
MVSMGIAHLPQWDITAIEIALDLEAPRISALGLSFSGYAEPRICLVAAFALTPQLKRIVAAVDRALPARLPPTLRIVPSPMRAAVSSAAITISILPLPALIRIQSRLIRAIQPGLADPDARADDMDEAISHYIREFIPSNTLPALEPSQLRGEFTPAKMNPLSVTMYHLNRAGKPQSILGHWPYARGARRSIPLRGGP